MKTRPLCLGCTVFVIVLFFLLTIFPIKSYNVTTLEGTDFTFCGYVSSITAGDDGYKLSVRSNRRAASAHNIKGIIAYLKEGESLPEIGSKVSVNGRVSDFSISRNPGQFDFKRYYQIKGYDFALKNATIISKSRNYNYLLNTLHQLREKLCTVLKSILPKADAYILEAMLLGNKTDLDQEVKTLYQNAGISHTLAISGLHISLIGMAIYELLKRLLGADIKTAIITSTILILYGLLCQDAAATKRAIIMFIIMAAGNCLGRAYDLYTALGVAGVISLISNPMQIFDSSFLLSYLAVLSIGIFMMPLRKLLKRSRYKKIITPFLMSFCVTLLTLPANLYFFYQYSTYSFILNLIVIPMLPLLIGFGFISLIAGSIFPSLGSILGIPCSLILIIYEKLCKLCSAIPGNLIILGQPQMYQIVIYYLLIFVSYLFLIKAKSYKFLICIFVAVFIIFYRPISGLELTVIDVGQGNSVLLRTKDVAILFDAGSSDIKSAGDMRIGPFLKSQGISKLDALFISHTDADHINAIKELCEKKGIGIDTLLMSKNSIKSDAGIDLISFCKQRNISVKKVGFEDEFFIDDLKIKCIYPGDDLGDLNELSVVLLITYKNFKTLIPGDLEGEEGQRIVGERIDGKINCYIVAHHGSNGSSSEEFLSKIKPDVSFISCGVKNIYKHPSPYLLSRLTQIGSRQYVTSNSGAISLKSDGKTFRVSTYLNEDKQSLGSES